MYSILKPKKINGFTLLEMIIALGIFTFLSAIMATVLSSALSAYRAATGKNEAMLQARTAMDWLVREIESANDPAINLTENGASAITFTTPYLPGIRYFLNTTNPNNYIIQRRKGAGSSQNDTMAENVTRFSLQYYDITNTPVTTNFADVRVVEVYINTTRNGQNFEGYTTARFQP